MCQVWKRRTGFQVFQGLKCRDVFSYTAMIVGFAINGEAKRALDIFAEMPTG